MATDGIDEQQKSFTISGFYGRRNKRKWSALEKTVEERVKKHQAEKVPEEYHGRIMGPTVKWETFYRQHDAFEFARSTAKDLCVFAFESCTLNSDSGQRMYLAASYPVFWHYYSQLSPEKRNHYEVIPEGAVCKLYFDLEFMTETNPERDGNEMVDILIKEKFLELTMEAGIIALSYPKFVCLCLKTEFKVNCSRPSIIDLEASTPSKFSRHLIFLLNNVAFKDNIQVGNFVIFIFSQLLRKVRPKEEVKTDPAEVNKKEESDFEVPRISHDQEGRTVDNGTDGSVSMKTNSSASGEECAPAASVKETVDGLLSKEYEAIFDQFTQVELESLIVKNKNGEEVLFCDTGVYTKNRNFRLFLSSKLGKKNPLLMSKDNQYQSQKTWQRADKTIFMDSLVANVDLDGYEKSPYPEVDNFVSRLVTREGADGAIRHWTYFHQGELLLYEIARYRYCENIGRQHRSNNIMFVVDLSKGVYYQKCHDPDCQSQNFRSQNYPVPADVLPASYFEEDLDFEVEDEEFLNATAEMEQNYLNTSVNANSNEFSDKDNDDLDLSKALDDAEQGFAENNV